MNDKHVLINSQINNNTSTNIFDTMSTTANNVYGGCDASRVHDIIYMVNTDIVRLIREISEPIRLAIKESI